MYHLLAHRGNNAQGAIRIFNYTVLSVTPKVISINCAFVELGLRYQPGIAACKRGGSNTLDGHSFSQGFTPLVSQPPETRGELQQEIAVIASNEIRAYERSVCYKIGYIFELYTANRIKMPTRST